MPSLIPLAPRGLGTPWVEALTSLVRRLTVLEVRRVRDILQILDISFEGLGKYTASTARSTVNGALENTRGLVAALERWTGLTDVGSTTLLALDAGVYVTGGMRQERRWCSRCLKEGGYDQELWSMRDYTVCARHALVLVDRCPRCKRTQLPWSMAAGVRKCLACGASLCRGAKQGEPTVRDLKCVEIIGHVATGGTIPAGGVARGIREALARFDMTENAFADRCAVDRSRLRVVLAGTSRPGLDFVVRVMAAMDLSVLEFSRPGLVAARVVKPARTRRHDLAAFGEALKAELQQPTEARRTLVEIATILRSSVPYLRQHFRAETELIIRDGILLRSARRDALAARERGQILAAAADVRARGAVVSQKSVGRELTRPLFMKARNRAVLAEYLAAS
jgi:ribosomal protein S27E